MPGCLVDSRRTCSGIGGSNCCRCNCNSLCRRIKMLRSPFAMFADRCDRWMGWAATLQLFNSPTLLYNEPQEIRPQCPIICNEHSCPCPCPWHVHKFLSTTVFEIEIAIEIENDVRLVDRYSFDRPSTVSASGVNADWKPPQRDHNSRSPVGL